MRKLFAFTARLIAKKRKNRLVESLYQKLDLFLKKSNNLNFYGHSNGEVNVLKVLSDYDIKTVFDVGANRGEWIKSASEFFPKASFHAFELVPSTFSMLEENLKGMDQVKLNPFGLSDFTGSIPIYVGPYDDISTTFKVKGTAAHEEYYSEELECKAFTGKEYMSSVGVEEIDFLKIDTEGNDFRVIKGFEEQIKKVKVIQFEYGIFNISSKDLLCDFYHYLSENGFKVGKIFPEHVDFTPYHFDMENFHGGNFLAIRNDMPDLQKRFS
ncbi:FkbM family methyltransferase [Mongoliibacter ruber]|uniref:FkbM family methyltransferase n=1 Tax=Mongoliibacter ruber TaxID=1750599 RepID=A0A2T0WC32_9BACT|nr:FkbM family methyltransferase [Mongoliibacter ruber]PRY84074.1 FkbM family methyltransferase [Mongoliibacter ruber]